MRIHALIASVLILGLAGAATAQPNQSVSYSPEFQTALEEDYGAREGEYLNERLTHYVAEALAARGVSANGLTIELSIINAEPNRPTMEQLAATPGLDGILSRSIGGAELHGVLRNASGAVVAEVEHSYFSSSLEDSSYALDTWGDARRSMRRFARKVADAYVANAG